MHENLFSLIWKSDGTSFDKTKKELKDKFKVIDNIISDKHEKHFPKNEQKPKKIQSQLTNVNLWYRNF